VPNSRNSRTSSQTKKLMITLWARITDRRKKAIPACLILRSALELPLIVTKMENSTIPWGIMWVILRKQPVIRMLWGRIYLIRSIRGLIQFWSNSYFHFYNFLKEQIWRLFRSILRQVFWGCKHLLTTSFFNKKQVIQTPESIPA
jgi:hypothetical protein